MPNIHELSNNIALQLSNKDSGEVSFSNIDLKNAYSQLQLCTDTGKECNFSIVIYRFLRTRQYTKRVQKGDGFITER